MTPSLLVLLLLLIALLTAAATAVRCVSRIVLRHWVERRLHGAGAAEIYLERPQQMLFAAGAAVALAAALAGTVLGTAVQSPGRLSAAVVGYGLTVAFIGQLVPRAIARRWAPKLLPLLMPVLQAAQWLVAPLERAARALVRPIIPAEASPEPDRHRELEDLLREGELEGVGGRDEIAIITGVVRFGLTTLRDVMKPMEDVFALPRYTPRAELALQIAQSAFSRVPIYESTPDNVVGMFHAFDLLKDPEGELLPLRPVERASADQPCSELLPQMLRRRLHLAVVHDTDGRALGIVTLEDLLEELVGDIADEHDEAEVAPGEVAA